MHRAANVAAVGLLLLLQACAPTRPAPSLRVDDPDRVPLTTFDPLPLEEFVALDPGIRAAREAEAEHLLAPVRKHAKHRHRRLQNEMRIQRDWSAFRIQVPREQHRLPYLIWSLEAAVTADPGFTSAWLQLARFQELLGDHELALAAYEGAARAAPLDPRLPSAKGMTAYVTTRRAWRLRDLGRTREGLDLMETLHAEYGRGPVEAQLVHGLLLGDAGRFSEAMQVAMDLPPIKVPYIHLYTGINPAFRTSSYLRNWIQAVAWLGVDEPVMARHALRELNFHQRHMPYKFEYWQDVGLVCELKGDVEDARIAYSIALTDMRASVPFMRWDSFTTPPVIGGVPHVRIPAFASYDVNLLAGSRFTLGAQLTAECSQAANDSLREYRGRAAVKHLGVCMERGIRPVLAQALRGRAHYHLGENAAAERDLRAACGALDARGEDDAGSLLVLGTLLYQDERIDEAVPFLERATRAEPDFAGPWRTLGAAYASLDRPDDALAAMDRAVALDPGSSMGWYNRGFFHAANGELEAAASDLGVALRIAPGNAQAAAVAQQVAARLGASGREAELHRAMARSDSLAADVPSVREGRMEQDFGVIALGRIASRDRHAVPVTDYSALADSLATRLTADSPTAERHRLADAYLRSDRPREAARLLTGSDDAEVLRLRLRCDRALGRTDRALALVRTRPDLDDPDLWSLAAMICLEQDHREEGLLALDRALAANPGNTGLMRYRQFVLSGR